MPTRQAPPKISTTKVRSVRELLDKIDEHTTGWERGANVRPWFRGQADAGEPLLPSVLRVERGDDGQEYEYDEVRMTLMFRLKALAFAGGQQTPETSRLDQWLFLMQHYGLPTRLLDWTENPPGFTAVALLTLALGIGANTAIYSLVDAVLLKPLPYPDPERLVSVFETSDRSPGRLIAASFPNFADWRAQHHVFERLATYKNDSAIVMKGPEPERVLVARVSSDYFAVFGAYLALGRGFEEEDARPGAAPVAVVSHTFWQQRLSGDIAVIGQTLRLAVDSPTIVGVLPQGFPDETPVYRPLQVAGAAGARQTRQFPVVGRLRGGITIEQAQRELDALARRLAAAYPENVGWGVLVESYAQRTAPYARPTLFILLGAVGFILLIACANVASLTLARSAARTREIAIRASLGATRRRLVRQLLIESVTLGLAGGAGGTLVAWATLDSLLAIVPLRIPETATVQVDLRVLAFTFGLSLATGVFFGLAPALRLSRIEAAAELAQAGRTSGPVMSRRLARSLIAAEIALALVLLTGAALMLRSLARLYAVDVGFSSAHVVTMEVTPIRNDRQTYVRYYQALLDRVRALPGVVAAGATDAVPLSGARSFWMARAEGDPAAAATKRIVVHQVMPGYFEALRIPLRGGRLLADTDREGTPAVAVITEEAARQFFPGRNPMGGRLYLGNDPVEIVGVVGDVRTDRLSERPVPELFKPYLQGPGSTTLEGRAVGQPLSLIVLTSGNPAAIAPALRAQAHAIGDPALVRRIRMLDEWIALSVTRTRQSTGLLILLGGLGLLLALVGVFGIASYTVAQRTREMGIRMALGATPGDVVRSLVGSIAVGVWTGIGIGLAGAAWATRVIASSLFGVTPTDPVAFGTVAAGLALIAGLATYVPARRAARIDPITVLREE